MIGPRILAERDPGGHLALIDREVGVHLRAGRVADHKDAVHDPEPIVGLEDAAVQPDADGLQAEPGERVRAPDGQEDLVARDRRAVGQLEEVGTVAPSFRAR